MKNILKLYLIMALSMSLMTGCNSSKQQFDASGVFEAEQTIVSAKSTGKLISFKIEEGENLKIGQEVGQIDCQNINLQKLQVQSSISAMKLRKNEANPQVQILVSQAESQRKILATQKQQLTVIENERKRIQNLLDA